ncbi:MAG: thioesterase [Bdellovibrio sp. ArHS]|uniref:thioesterase family protein n=1 Tax=Bdellovibrio sp. ArHS TaxID=1569284 RepID=UPI000583FFF4|nr:thioesterase family protein [Bdellovibrio sp. ArHS]KHD89887.1 MAG: thioesterase [Bdellovibrio sp. ArHS]
MNLFFRLMHIFLFSRFRKTVGIMDECATPFRVWPTDLDVLMHMNNGVYLSLQDLARVDYMIRAGAAKIISANGWYPVVASETIRFRRSLQPFQKFELRTRLIAWDEKYLYLEHKFTSRGEVMAVGMIRARFLAKKGGLVAPQDLLKALNLEVSSPAVPAHLQSWLSADQEHSRSLGL